MWTSRTGTELSTGSAQTLPLDRRTRSPRRTKKASLEGLTLVRFILDPAELGGAVLDVDVLDRALVRRQEIHIHKVFLSRVTTHGWIETYGPSTISYHPIHYREAAEGSQRDRIAARLESTLSSLARRHRPDVIANHVAETEAGVIVSSFARDWNIPLMIQMHGGEMPKMELPDDHKAMLDEVIKQFTRSADLADAVTAVSDSAQNLVPDHDLTNLWTGADPTFYDPAGVRGGYLRDKFDILDCHPVILLPARIVVEKGHKLLLDALQILFERGLDFRVVFAGSGTPVAMEQLDQYLLANGFSGVVHKLIDATQGEMRAVYKGSDIVALPGYHFEGCPRCILEAQLMEKPVVATDSGGTRESFVDGKSGFLAPVGDVLGLANALEPLIKDADLRRRFGKFGRRHVISRFDLDALAARHEDVYRKVMRRPLALATR